MPRSNKNKTALKPPIKHPPLSYSPSSSSAFQAANINQGESLMVHRASLSARKHDIDLKQGTLNKGRGNCAFESALFNVNDRSCFSQKFPLSADYYCRIWMTDMKNRTMNDQTWNIYTNLEWKQDGMH